MKLLRLKSFVLSSLLMLALMQLGGESGSTQSLRVSGDYAVGELLVKFEAGSSNRREKLARVGLETIGSFSNVGWQHVRLPPGITVEEGIARYRRLAGVERVQPNFIYRSQATANDPRFSELYGLNKIQAPLAWDLTTGSPSVVVAVIDLGVDYNHEDLSANLWRNPGETGLSPSGQDRATNGIDDDGNGYVDDVFGVDTINHDSDPMDDGGHGTHVSGTIGGVGNNSTGVVGVNWDVRIMAIKSHAADGNGTSASVVEAFQYVAMMRRRGINVRVTNNSWGGAPEAANFDQALKDAIDAAGSTGILNVCAAGNNNNRDNDANPFFPASYDSPSIMSVAASDQNDNRAGFSSRGATSVDLAAPGVFILSTLRGSTYGFLSGTSMATPHTSGAAALLWAQAPHLTVAQVKATLMNNVDVLPQWAGLTVTGGRLNVARAVQNAPAAHQLDNPEFFVHQQYQDFLSREPDPAGRLFWFNEIAQCGLDAGCIEVRRINVSAAFFLSIEFQHTGYLVYRIYKSAYGNQLGVPVPVTFGEFQPDTQEISRDVVVGEPGWEQLLVDNKNRFAALFVATPRFASRYPTITPDSFVDALFSNANVTPTTVERDAAINEFGGASTSAEAAARARVLLRVAENSALVSQEFNKAFVLMQYFGYLRRNPNDAPDADFTGYNFWLAKLDQFNGNFINAEMVKAFLASSEYRQRFGPP